MQTIRHPADAIEVAIRLEILGENFYRALSSRAEAKDVTAFFSAMADSEVEHRSAFHRLKRNEDTARSKHWEPRYGQFLQQVATASVDTLGRASSVSRSLSLDGALEMAIHFEQESIIFFTTLMLSVDDEEHGGVVHRVVEEEKEHLEKLKAFRKKHG